MGSVFSCSVFPGLALLFLATWSVPISFPCLVTLPLDSPSLVDRLVRMIPSSPVFWPQPSFHNRRSRLLGCSPEFCPPVSRMPGPSLSSFFVPPLLAQPVEPPEAPAAPPPGDAMIELVHPGELVTQVVRTFSAPVVRVFGRNVALDPETLFGSQDFVGSVVSRPPGTSSDPGAASTP